MDFLRLLAAHRVPALDFIFQNITFLAQEIVVVAVIAWLFWCKDKELGYTLGFSYFFSGLLVQGLKITFRIPRPWVLDSDFSPVESAVSGATGYSFPSGHTQSASALYGTIGVYAKKKAWKCLWFFLIALIAFSRMYLGVHTPKDVLTACLLTLLIVFLFWKFGASVLLEDKNTVRTTLLLLALCVVLIIYALALRSDGICDSDMAIDALKAASAGIGFAIGYYIERTRITFTLPGDTKTGIIRFFVGLISIALLKGIFKVTLQQYEAIYLVTYGVLILWLVTIYPALFTLYEARRQRSH